MGLTLLSMGAIRSSNKFTSAPGQSGDGSLVNPIEDGEMELLQLTSNLCESAFHAVIRTQVDGHQPHVGGHVHEGARPPKLICAGCLVSVG
jgi:hypothetical protein